jgi:hypothetical protein
LSANSGKADKENRPAISYDKQKYFNDLVGLLKQAIRF